MEACLSKDVTLSICIKQESMGHEGADEDAQETQLHNSIRNQDVKEKCPTSRRAGDQNIKEEPPDIQDFECGSEDGGWIESGHESDVHSVKREVNYHFGNCGSPKMDERPTSDVVLESKKNRISQMKGESNADIYSGDSGNKILKEGYIDNPCTTDCIHDDGVTSNVKGEESFTLASRIDMMERDYDLKKTIILTPIGSQKSMQLNPTCSESGNSDKSVLISNGSSVHHCGICNRVFGDEGCFDKHLSNHRVKDVNQTREAFNDQPTPRMCLRSSNRGKNASMNRNAKLKGGCKDLHRNGSIETKCSGKERVKETGSPHLTVANVGDKGGVNGNPCSNRTRRTRGRKRLEVTQRASPKRSRIHKCLECGHVFRKGTDLSRHMRTHSGEKPYSCTICRARFTRNFGLQCHQRSHAGVKLHCCSVCGKNYSRRYDLGKHEKMVHTGERPYVCSSCGKTYATSSNLRVHERLHTNSKPFLCPECGHRSNHRSDLKKHMRIHTNERPYCCIFCGQSFKQNNSLSSHIRNRHKTNS